MIKTLSVLFVLTACNMAIAGESLRSLPRSSPEAQGVSSSARKLCLYETPLCLTMRLEFKGDQVLVDTESNVGFGPTKRPQLVGHAK